MRKLVITLLSTALVAGTAAASDWTENVKVKGDLRYRHEMLKEGDSNARHRQRIRARVGIEGKVSDRAKIYIGLASGSADPVSTNQTLSGSFSTKAFSLDLAYMQLHHENFPGFTLTAGKIKNPFIKPGSSELIWDSDLHPEGAALAFEKALNENVSFKAVASGLWIEERSSSNDTWLGGANGELGFTTRDKLTDVAVGGGFFNYVNMMGYPVLFDNEDPFGNTAYDSSGTNYYSNDFEIMEVFGQATHHFDEIPVTVFADYANNTAADSNETAWLVGASIGHAKKPGSWSLRYNYRDVKSDAVVGLFNDSDFRGGGTNAKGHEMGGEWVIAKNTILGATYFFNKIDPNGADVSFKRMQLDLQLKF